MADTVEQMIQNPPQTIRTKADIWASQSLNVQIFSEEEIKDGIKYQGPVVSNQLNGALKLVYQLVEQMLGFGFYNENRDYDYNSIVCYIHQNEDSGQIGLEFARCVNQSVPNDLGIKQKPTTRQRPYTDANVKYGDTTKGGAGCIVSTPKDGVVNSEYWEPLRLYNHMGYKIVTKEQYNDIPKSQRTQDILYFIVAEEQNTDADGNIQI